MFRAVEHTLDPSSSCSRMFMLSDSKSWCRTSPSAYPSPATGNQNLGRSSFSSCAGAGTQEPLSRHGHSRVYPDRSVSALSSGWCQPRLVHQRARAPGPVGRRRRCDGGAAAHRALGCSWLQALAQMWVHQVLQLGVHWYGTCRRSMPRGHATDTGESGAARGGCSSAALLCVRRPCAQALPALGGGSGPAGGLRRRQRGSQA